MNPSERLERIIDSNSKSLTDFANKYGYNKSTLHNYIKGRDMDSKFIISLKENLNVNPTWLLTGEGEMFLNPPLSPFEKGGVVQTGNGVNVIGNNNTIHHYNYKLDEAEKEVIDSIRQSKKRERVLAAIKAVLGIGVLLGAVNFFV